MVHTAGDVLDQIAGFGIQEAKISRLVILHSHFDHCGLVPFFKRRWPQMVVCASARAKQLLEQQKVVAGIAALNQAVIDAAGMQDKARALGLDFDGIAVEQTLAEGQEVVCGELTFQCLAVPGHSSCSIAIYLPAEKALFTSDAAGIPFGEKIFTVANANFDQYMESLGKMAALKPELILAEHYGVRGGVHARSFFEASVASARRTRGMIEAIWARTGDIDTATTQVTDWLMADAGAGFMARDIVAIVAGQMVRYIAKTGKGTGS
jgi:glyoxylase-like metal-dependent hydrolase (beta-lactamase superfamily II)